MPSTKTAPKPATPAAETEPESTETETRTETAAEKTKRQIKVQYAFDEGVELEVADDIPEQVHIPRDTSGLVGRQPKYLGLLERVKNEYPGKAVKLASFGNSGPATTARNELLGLEVVNRRTKEVSKAKQRELPEGTTADDWEVEVRRVMEPNKLTGENERVHQLWVKYVGK